MSDRYYRAEMLSWIKEFPELETIRDDWFAGTRDAICRELERLHGLSGPDDPRRRLVYPKGGTKTDLIHRLVAHHYLRLSREQNT